MFLTKITTLASVLTSVVSASPCPYGDLAERGLLPKREADKFFAARDLGEASVEHQLKERSEDLQKREFDAQEKFYKRQLSLGSLPLGGGLLNGVLQPLTGLLAGLGLPRFITPLHMHSYDLHGFQSSTNGVTRDSR